MAAQRIFYVNLLQVCCMHGTQNARGQHRSAAEHLGALLDAGGRNLGLQLLPDVCLDLLHIRHKGVCAKVGAHLCTLHRQLS